MASNNTKKPLELDARVQKIIDEVMMAEHDPYLHPIQDVAMHHRIQVEAWAKISAKIKELNEYGRVADESANTTAGTTTTTAN